MTVSVFLIILTICSVVTTLIVEGVKKMLGEKRYSANILALIISVIVGAIATILYYIFNSMEFNTVNIICIPLMVLANWLCSMLGYDKIKQAILQLGKE